MSGSCQPTDLMSDFLQGPIDTKYCEEQGSNTEKIMHGSYRYGINELQLHDYTCKITIALQWCHNGHDSLKSPASRLFTQSFIYSNADQRKHQSSASLAFVRGIHRGPVNSLHKWPVTRKMFPFDDVIMATKWYHIDTTNKCVFLFMVWITEKFK